MQTRVGYRWTINECLQLQREYELLGLSIQEIAERHGRTVSAIMYKLDQEGLADYNVLYSNFHELNSPMPVTRTQKYKLDFDSVSESVSESESESESECEQDEESVEDISELKKHIMRLEKQVNGITELLTKQTKNSKSVFSLFA